MYDAVAEAVPLAQMGRHRKKALVIISDGNDTSSRTDVLAVKQMIRETEVLVYAIGIDSQNDSALWRRRFTLRSFQTQGTLLQRRPPRVPTPFPFPFPGGRRPSPPPSPPTFRRRRAAATRRDRRATTGVNVAALRDITDDSGGRTEIIRGARDLDPATAGIADELSKQYYLGYASTGVKDGRWHTIRVEVRNGGYIVRARRGFVATP